MKNSGLYPAICSMLFFYTANLSTQWSTNSEINNAKSTATNHQRNAKIVSDGTGGAIITWFDYRNIATTGVDICAQKINASGAYMERKYWCSNNGRLCVLDDMEYRDRYSNV